MFLNTVTLSSDHLYIEDPLHLKLELANMLFSLIFLLELNFKIAGLGFKRYFNDKFNLLDAVNVFFSVGDFAYIAIFGIKATQNTDLTSLFRASRLFRLIKIAKNWQKFENLLITIWKSV